MRKFLSVTLLAILTLVAPAVSAGTPSEPEAVDDAGDAPAPLDITSAWFSTPSAGRVRVTFKLSDLATVAPAADDNTNDLRYYYRIDLQSSLFGGASSAECMVSLAELAGTGVGVNVGPSLVGSFPTPGTTVGTRCESSHSGSTSTRHFTVSGVADMNADTFTLTLTQSYVPLDGATLSGITLTTWSGPAAESASASHRGAAPVDEASANDYAVGS